MASQLFRQEALSSQIERQWGDCIDIKITGMSFLACLLALVVLVSGWFLITGEYKRKTTISGMLVTDRGAVQVRAPKEGIVEDLSVEQGDRVGKGNTLLVLQSGNSNAEIVSSLLLENSKQLALLDELIRTEKKTFAEEKRQLQIEHIGMEAQHRQLVKQFGKESDIKRLQRIRYESLKTMSEKGLLAKTDIEDIRVSILKQESKLEQLKLELVAVRQKITLSKGNETLRLLKHQERITRLEHERTELHKQSLELKNQRAVSVVSPVEGMVANLNRKSGQAVVSHEVILSLIQKDSTLEAKLFIPSRAIGFVEDGLPVNLRFDAYPYQKYGLQKARVTQVSESVLHPGESQDANGLNESYYTAMAVLDRQYIAAFGEREPLKPGMKFTASIVLESRSLLEWLLEPLYIRIRQG